jgi:hypothetical protein
MWRSVSGSTLVQQPAHGVVGNSPTNPVLAPLLAAGQHLS